MAGEGRLPIADLLLWSVEQAQAFKTGKYLLTRYGNLGVMYT